ncbi:MAG: hypothetical protein FJ086_04760 [Deltaproteobacteria bacterium]|nr:hypothetical protein [Deltaproteobacteria bacterium]
MFTAHAVALLVLTADPGGTGWEKDAESDGVTIFARKQKGAEVREMKAEGLINAPPMAVWKAIRDYDNYKKTMPYTAESRVISQDAGGKTTLFYSVVNAPLVDKRDYFIKLLDQSDWKDGKGYLKVTWSAVQDPGTPEREGFVRVRINDGMWLLEPRGDGGQTFATYWVYTNPGGSIPNWIADRANGTAVPDVFKAIRKVTAGKK